MTSFQRFAGGYRAVALITFNTLALFVVVNLVLFVGDGIVRYLKGRPQPAIVRKYGVSVLQKVYPSLSKEDLLRLLEETWTRQLAYEPFTEIKEGAFAGRFVNVDTNGFRRGKNQSLWPPSPENFNVFVFGGSTTFGYGVPDNETVPSFLQDKLASPVAGRKVCLFNFGRAYYYATQERILFEQLLTGGFKPDAAIFIDGLNEFFYIDDRPKFSQKLAECVSGEDRRRNRLGMLAEWPVMRKLAKLSRFLSKAAAPATGSLDAIVAESETLTHVAAVYICERYLSNQRLIQATAERWGVPICFVWQPVPTYKYDLANHLFMEKGFGQHQRSAQGYPTMAALLATNLPANNFLWCADIQENLKKPLYVDAVHYSGGMNDLFAAEIARQVNKRGLLRQAR
jgi:hypothetical protein